MNSSAIVLFCVGLFVCYFAGLKFGALSKFIKEFGSSAS